MKKLAGYVKNIALGIMIFSAPMAFAGTEMWLDATHFFDKEVKQLAKEAKLETKSNFARISGISFADRKEYEVGDSETFWTKNIVEDKFEQTKAKLKAIGKHCYIFVEESQLIGKSTIEKIKNSFDNNIYPTNTKNFGSEWKPGVDDDERITLLLLDIKDGYNGTGGYVAGYFFAGDEYLNSQMPSHFNIKSNEREMFYLDTYPSKPSSDHYMSVVAHEFQHMIHFHQDKNEYTWVNEACSQIAPYLCGFDHAPQILAFKKTPDNSLTAWSKKQMLANYGQVYLWHYYIYNRYIKGNPAAADFFKTLVSSQEQGIHSYKDSFELLRYGFTGIFNDFAVANFINDHSVGDKFEYAYDKSLANFKLPPTHFVKTFPAEYSGEVCLWGADAIELDLTNAKSELTIDFEGFLGKFMYYYYNEFKISLVLQDSSGKKPTEIKKLYCNPLKDRKLQGGTLKITPAKEFDKALLIISAYFEEEVDDIQYSNAKPMTYKVRISDGGTDIARDSSVVCISEIAQSYLSLTDLDVSNEQALIVAMNSLEAIKFKFSKKLKADLSSNNIADLQKFVELVEAGKIDATKVKILIDEAITQAQFAHLQQTNNLQLKNIIKSLKNL